MILREPTDQQLYSEEAFQRQLERETDMFEASDIYHAAREAYIEDFYYSSSYIYAFKEWLTSHES